MHALPWASTFCAGIPLARHTAKRNVLLPASTWHAVMIANLRVLMSNAHPTQMVDALSMALISHVLNNAVAALQPVTTNLKKLGYV